MKRQLGVFVVLVGVGFSASCSGDVAKEVAEPTVSPTVHAASSAQPPATAADCAADPVSGEKFTAPAEASALRVDFPALPGWEINTDADLAGARTVSVINDQSVVHLDVSKASLAPGAQLAAAKTASESLAGWKRLGYRQITMCGFSGIANSGTFSVVGTTYQFALFATCKVGDEEWFVSFLGQTRNPDDEAFARDFPKMVAGLRFHT
ncbi:hypothetical protein [Antrihabitans sp. YC2-6]|uniref:hypothetical protein n=1 Tax=Antrihabitans sp. YC2-6 TaxID=2799498 RepID=UPI0018F5573E|nr:hypothetical protein [Antrihabitans sp. YC2-6]MBJ8347623.1 hypothetical protein [Antrihabitans sp. YC2-6]